ncbi:YhjD/YihY/BrkB family envelope integrity protein, partial [Halobium palmae]
PAGLLVGVAGFVGLWVALSLAFLPMYYVPSEAVTSPRGALPGAVTASFGWALLHAVFHFYSTHAGQYAVYGVLSGIVVLLTGLYLAASLLLIGIVVNAQVAERYGDRDADARDPGDRDE